MATSTGSVVWFSEVGRNDLATVGGKGANLGELTRANIPVPPGFIVTADTYFKFLRANGLAEVIEEELAGLDVNDSTDLELRAGRLRQRLLFAKMPAEIAHEIRAAYASLGAGPVAVRSSATAEDLPEASFAGQQRTFLNVDGADDVLHAVQACWASLFETRAVFYRQAGGYDHLKVGLAVPVQRMIQSEISGVMFTIEPVTSDRSKITIEAVYGLGEGIVSGEISPDLYIVDKASLELRSVTPARQERMLTRASRDKLHFQDMNEWVPVPPQQAERQKLDEAQIHELATIARVLEEHYNAPQDIEWAYQGGKFFITQTRPVTTLRSETSPVFAGEAETAPVLVRGQPAGPGVAAGTVRILRDPSQIDLIEAGDILIAEMTTPDFVPAMKRAAAIVTERGGRTCHAAIVSRELGIPCVVGAAGAIAALSDGMVVTVDGSDGAVYLGRAQARIDWAEAQRERFEGLDAPLTKTKIYVNLAEPERARAVAAMDTDGVGLLRAEFMVAQTGTHPRTFIAEGHPEAYTNALAGGIAQFCAAFQPRQVVYRLTDFKTNEYANLRGGRQFEPAEENPMIGFRGASRYIREPEVFALKIAAIKKVREEYPNLCVMVPFVRTPAELLGVKQLLAQHGLERGDNFKLWMMVEVPSNILILDRFLDVGIDGISIGSNDLTQLILGIDRDSELLAETFDERNEAVMQALETAVRGARRRGVTASICGQAPSVYPELTEKLVEWGITSVSVSPDMIDATRRIVAAAEAKLGTLATAR